MSLYSLDIGNAFSVLFDGKSYWKHRSVIAPLQSYLNVRGRNKNTTLRYREKIYHIGDDALRYPLYRVFAEHDKQSPVTINDSICMTLMLLQTMANNNPKYVPADIGLIIQVPETVTDYHHKVVQALNSVHLWESEGKQYQTRIKVQDVYPEGFGSWFMSKRQHQIGDSGVTVVVDVGGGTVVATAFENQSGEVLQTLSYAKAGVVGLANLVRNDNDVRAKNNGTVITVEDIFKALEDKSHTVGITGINIHDAVEFYKREWWNNIFRGIVNDYDSYFKRRMVSRILVTGGGAELVRPNIESAIRSGSGAGKLFAMANQPLMDNVLGIYYATTSRG